MPRLVSPPKYPIGIILISEQPSPPLGLSLIHQGNPYLDFLILSLSYGERFLNGFCVFWMLLVSVRALKFLKPLPLSLSHTGSYLLLPPLIIFFPLLTGIETSSLGPF